MTGSEDRRNLKRIPVAPDGPLSVSIEMTDGRQEKFKIKDYHASGLALVWNLSESLDLSLVSRLHLSYGRRNLATYEAPKISLDKAKKLLRVDLSDGIEEGEEITSLIPKHMRPIIMGEDPLRIGEQLHIWVESIGLDTILANTSKSNRHLLKGIELPNMVMILPTVGQVTLAGVIKKISPLEDSLKLEISYSAQNEEGGELIYRYLIAQSGEEAQKTLTEFSKRNSSIGSRVPFGAAVRIQPASSREEYLKVLEVRLEAYRSHGKVLDGETIMDMGDEYDERSLILVAKVGEVIAGTIRFTYCHTDDDKFSFERQVSFNEISEGRRSDFYEISKLAILPNFRGADILPKLFQRMALEVIPGKKGAFCLSTDRNTKHYLTAGAIKLVENIPHPKLKGEKLTMFLFSSDSFSKGLHMKSLAWEYIAKGVLNNLHEFGVTGKVKTPLKHKLMIHIERAWIKRKLSKGKKVA